MDLIEKQQEFLNQMCALVPHLTEPELDRMLCICLGANLMVRRRETAAKGGDNNA